MKVLKVILGILAILCGITCLAYPFLSEIVYAYIAAGFIGIWGLITIIDYCINKGKGNYNELEASVGAVNLVLGILGVIFLILTLAVDNFIYSVQQVIAVLFLIWMLVDGILTIITSITVVRKLEKGTWVWLLILGILFVMAAVVGFGCLPAVLAAFGIMLGIGFFVFGVRSIASVFE